MNLEKQIYSWYGNSGDSVYKDDLILVLLQMLNRIEELESKLQGEK